MLEEFVPIYKNKPIQHAHSRMRLEGRATEPGSTLICRPAYGKQRHGNALKEL
jgi:hypothetical protein